MTYLKLLWCVVGLASDLGADPQDVQYWVDRLRGAVDDLQVVSMEVLDWLENQAEGLDDE